MPKALYGAENGGKSRSQSLFKYWELFSVCRIACGALLAFGIKYEKTKKIS